MKYFIVLFLFFVSCKKKDFGYTLNVGDYGGIRLNIHTIMKVSNQKTSFEFTCAKAQIDENLLLVTHKKFKKEGTFQFQHGTVIADFDLKNAIIPALFIFEVKGKNVKVLIVNLKDSSEIGTYEFEFGADANVFKCA